MLRAILFDMDGVIFDSEPLYSMGCRHSMKMHGLPIDEDAIMKAKGACDKEFENIIMKAIDYKIPYKTFKKERDSYMLDYIKEHGVPIKKGLIELLTYLKDNHYKISVATATVKSVVDVFFDLSGIRQYFDAIITGDMISPDRGKPQPDIYIKAAKTLDVISSECLVLEDSYNGIRAGYNAGCKVIMIPDMVEPTPEIEKMTDAILPSLDKVIDYLEDNN